LPGRTRSVAADRHHLVGDVFEPEMIEQRGRQHQPCHRMVVAERPVDAVENVRRCGRPESACSTSTEPDAGIFNQRVDRQLAPRNAPCCCLSVLLSHTDILSLKVSGLTDPREAVRQSRPSVPIAPVAATYDSPLNIVSDSPARKGVVETLKKFASDRDTRFGGIMHAIDEWGMRHPALFAVLSAVCNVAIFALLLDTGDSRVRLFLVAVFVGTCIAAYSGRVRARRRIGKPSLAESVRRFWRSMN
jgi:hypothetical protein